MRRSILGFFSIACCIAAITGIVPAIVCVEASSSRTSQSYQYYLKGLLLDRAGEYEHARDAYTQALKSDTGAQYIHYRLAIDYIRLNDLAGSSRELRRLLQSNPHDEKTRFLLALVYSYQAKYAHAIREYRFLLSQPLLELDENDIRTFLGRLYVLKGDLAEAQNEYRVILEEKPNDPDVHFFLGFIYNELSRQENAIQEFIRALEIDPNHPLALNSLSYLYAQREEKLDTAFNLVRKALEIEPTNGAFLDTLGWVYFKKGDTENALRYLENASVFYRDAEIFEHIGDVHFHLQHIDEAKKNWNKALELDSRRSSVRTKLRNVKKAQ